MPKLLNYTTGVATEKTLGEINHLLATHGARRIIADYDKAGNPEAIMFSIETPYGVQDFRLPANVEGVSRALVRGYEQRRVERRFTGREQATRVAWRIVKDWLEAQVAIIEAGMMTMDQAMLPHLLAPGGRTFYSASVENRLQLPRHDG